MKNPLYPIPNKPTTKWVTENMLSRPMRFCIVWGEVIEIFEEFLKGDYKAMLIKFNQVWYCLLLFFHAKTNINVPMFFSYSVIKAHAKRQEFWWELFNKYKVKWSMKYFLDGTNWERPSKIISTMSRVNINISKKQANTLIDTFQKYHTLTIHSEWKEHSFA